jgi:hypothetical protein
MSANEQADPQVVMAQAQLEKLQLEVKKLRFDVESQGSTSFKAEKFMRFLPLVTVLIAVGGFWFTVFQYNNQQRAAAKQQADAAAKLAADREQDLLRPFFQKRLELYFTAAETGAAITLSKDKAERDKAEAKFMQLYSGSLIIVEDAEFEKAMIAFHKCLTGEEPCDENELLRRAHAIGSRARDSIGKSYNIKLEDLKGKY